MKIAQNKLTQFLRWNAYFIFAGMLCLVAPAAVFAEREDDSPRRSRAIMPAPPNFVFPHNAQNQIPEDESGETVYCLQNINCEEGEQYCDLATHTCKELICGNGIVEGNEGCDDGNSASGDGCDNDCRIEDGEQCSDNYECQDGFCDDGVCSSTVCGDGDVGAGEECDDGNTVSGDGCSNICETELSRQISCGGDSLACMTSAECSSQGGNCMGADTDCDSCCCQLPDAPVTPDCPDGYMQTRIDLGGGNVLYRSILCTECTVAETLPGTYCMTCVPDPNPVNCDDCPNDHQCHADKVDCSVTLSGPSTGPEGEVVANAPSGSVEWTVAGPVTYSPSSNSVRFECTSEGSVDFYAQPTDSACSDASPGTHSLQCQSSGICIDDAQCESGQYCDVNGQCVDGICGDGHELPSEECDDGNTVNGDGCDRDCRDEECGNGLPLQSGEECDDGNTANGDGCDSNCIEEVCGNTIVQSGETCDDGNTSDGDGCDSNCIDEVCGNGIVQSGEGCDDGNVVNGDGCTSTCAVEANCGDNTLHSGEECDDGNTINEDGCSSACLIEDCGDGTMQAALGETCDDGNTTAGDGCDASCQLETTCGNSTVESPVEECDDGNTVSKDGCSSTCQKESCNDIQAGWVAGTDDCSECARNTGIKNGNGSDCYECADGIAPILSEVYSSFPGCVPQASCSNCYAQQQAKKTCPASHNDIDNNVLEDQNPCCYDVVDTSQCADGRSVTECTLGNEPAHDVGIQWASETISCSGEVIALPHTSSDKSSEITVTGIWRPICEDCVKGGLLGGGDAECRVCPPETP